MVNVVCESLLNWRYGGSSSDHLLLAIIVLLFLNSLVVPKDGGKFKPFLCVAKLWFLIPDSEFVG